MREKPIAIIDDDEKIQALLKRYLEENAIFSKSFYDAESLLAQEKINDFSLFIIDINLPKMDGLTLCSRLRALEIFIPIIMLTARGDETDRIVGLEMGADDYLPKPFHPRELLARIKALLRRQQYLVTQLTVSPTPLVAFGDFTFDQNSLILKKDEEIIALTSGETALLQIFLQHSGKVLSREQLMDKLHGRELSVYDRAIDVQVSRLRKLLGDDPKNPRFIKTVRHIGYRFVPDAKN